MKEHTLASINVMKTRSSSGDSARYVIGCYSNNVVVFEQIILSAQDLSEMGYYASDRIFFGKRIWHKFVSMKKESLYAITKTVLEILK